MLKKIKLYLAQEEPTREVTVRRLTPKNVIAIGQFGRQLMGAGVTKGEIESLFTPDGIRIADALALVWDKLADPNAEIGKESALEAAFFLLLQTITGLSGDDVRAMTFEDLVAYGEAAMQQEAASRVGGLLRPMISNISPLLLDLIMPSTSAIGPGNQAAGSEIPNQGSGSSAEAKSNPGGGMNSGGLTPSSVPSSSEPDGPLTTASTGSPSEKPNNSDLDSPAST